MSRGIRGTALTGGLLAALVCSLTAGSLAQASTLPRITVGVSKAATTVGGSLESGAVNIVTTSSGVKEATVILFRLKPGATVAEAEAFTNEKKASKDPNNSIKLGTIVFDVEANPGAPTEAQTSLEPGEYVLLVGEGEKPVKVRTHFTITASNAPATLPAPQATVRSIEFGFRGPSTLKDGELVRFENEGFVVHMNFAFPVKNMANARKAVKELRAGKERAIGKLIAGPPVAFAGPLSHGAFQQETITAKPGIYVEVCFMDTQDGRSHTMLGMERIIRIKK